MWAIIWNWNMKKKYLELYIELIKLFVVGNVYEKKVCTVLPWWSTILSISTKWTTTSLSSNHWDQSHLHSKESYSTKEEEEHDLWCCKFYAIFIKLNQFFSRRGIWLVVFGADCISTLFVYIDVVHGFLLFFCIIGQPLEIIEIKEVIYYRLRSPSDSNQHSLKSYDLKSQSYLRVFSNRHPFQILISMADLLDQVRIRASSIWESEKQP